MDEKYRKIEEMFLKEDQKKASYEIRAFGSEYIIHPGVFSPEVRNNSLWYAERILKLISGDSFLEIGAGAGILCVEVAKKGMRVVATDIDEKAIENIKANVKKHNVKVDIRKGSVFAPIKEGEWFDNIFWNHPWICSDEEVDMRHKASFDYNYEALEKFIKEEKKYLTENGKIFLGTGNLARIDLIKQWAQEAGYEIKLECSEANPLAVGEDFRSEFYIYSFRINIA